MENQPKLNNSKEVIAYLAQIFPQCFIAEGEARPLKIGIFQDIVERLGENSCVSKTQLRAALRLYTTSWRYLYGVKEGVHRVDLDGNECGVLEKQHVEHAMKQLEEAKARVQAQRNAKLEAKKAKPVVDNTPVDKTKATASSEKKVVNNKTNSNFIGTQNKKKTLPNEKNAKSATPKINSSSQNLQKVKIESAVVPIKIEVNKLAVGQNVYIKVGQKAVDAVILEVMKDGVRVQLTSGMAMFVRAEHIQL